MQLSDKGKALWTNLQQKIKNSALSNLSKGNLDTNDQAEKLSALKSSQRNLMGNEKNKDKAKAITDKEKK